LNVLLGEIRVSEEGEEEGQIKYDSARHRVFFCVVLYGHDREAVSAGPQASKKNIKNKRNKKKTEKKIVFSSTKI
jgi:hypothetical protein